MTMQLRKDEAQIISLIRKANKYSTIKVDKRPSKEYPDGELTRVSVENNLLVAELVIGQN